MKRFPIRSMFLSIGLLTTAISCSFPTSSTSATPSKEGIDASQFSLDNSQSEEITSAKSSEVLPSISQEDDGSGVSSEGGSGSSEVNESSENSDFSDFSSEIESESSEIHSISSEEISSIVEESSEEFFENVSLIDNSLEFSESSVEESSEEKVDPKPTTIRVYATNDIHGQIYPENATYSSGRMGVGSMMTYLKNAKDSYPYTLLLDQGDTWQGSIYSNLNHGALITDIMNYVQFDARTVGNHDFDWGIDPIIENGKRSYEGYSTPVLAGNVYNFDYVTKTEGDIQREDIGVKSITKTFDTGCKVGVVGVIGREQITSITSLYTLSICFQNHIEIAKEEATRLREEEGCDVVILSAHAGEEDIRGYDLDDYFDLALCGHTHQHETYYDGTMPVVQFGSYTQSIGYVELNFNGPGTKVTTGALSTLRSSFVTGEVSSVDETIAGLIQSYGVATFEEAGRVTASRVEGYFDKKKMLPNLMCKAIYDTAIKSGYDIDFSYCNDARHYLGNSSYSTMWTYADLFEAFPFDNEIYIVEITTEEMEREVRNYNCLCKDPNKSLNLVSGQRYKMACIDYLAFHNDVEREFDYFPSITNYELSSIEKLDGTYRDILTDWLSDNGYVGTNARTLYASDYSSDLPQFSTSSIVW